MYIIILKNNLSTRVVICTNKTHINLKKLICVKFVAHKDFTVPRWGPVWRGVSEARPSGLVPGVRGVKLTHGTVLIQVGKVVSHLGKVITLKMCKCVNYNC